jgi:glycosyltransferase involved in cell wall biosynthesis
LAQTFQDFELIISDNASTDATPRICKEYVAKDSRVKYFINLQNIGAALNFTKVFELSSGKYFKWAAADDLCHCNLLEKCLEVLECDKNVVIAYPNTVVIDEEGKSIKMEKDLRRFDSKNLRVRFSDALAPMKYTNYPFYGLIRRNVLKKTRPMIKYMAADRVLLLELCLHGTFKEVSEALFYRRSVRECHRTPQNEVEYNTGLKGKKYYFYSWRVLWEYIKVVRLAKLHPIVIFELYCEILHWIILHRSGLRWDVTRNIKLLLGFRGI